MQDENVSRRGFMAGGAAAGVGAVLITAATADEPPAPDQTAALPLAEYKELNKVGGSVEVDLPDGTPLIVARVDETQFVCVTRKCTHANCDVAYDGDAKKFVCPCHQSMFNLDGKVVRGPARRPLKQYLSDLAVMIRPPKK
jgi:cytochrome b6-f complex iron-sulfur subunit